MLTSAPMPAALAVPATVRLRPIGIVALGLALVVAFGVLLGGEALSFVAAGLPAIALAGMAALARLGSERRWARVATLLLGGAMIAALGLILFGLSTAALLGPGPASQPGLAPGALPKLLLLLVGLTAGGLLGLVGLVPPWRRSLARRLPFDPSSFPAGVGAAAVLAATVMATVPLVVLATPPMLAAITAGQVPVPGTAMMLRQAIYGLLWLLPGAAAAAGWGLGRDRGAALARLGLVRPTGRQVLSGLAIALGLAVVALPLDIATARVWEAMGWPRTDGAWVTQLFGFALSPTGALVAGVTAGLGEELLVRGLLQPRVGLLLANLCFVSVHALQYNWDGLFQVFLLGIVAGLVRRRTNTTTCALVHGTYDALMILYTVVLGG